MVVVEPALLGICLPNQLAARGVYGHRRPLSFGHALHVTLVRREPVTISVFEKYVFKNSVVGNFLHFEHPPWSHWILKFLIMIESRLIVLDHFVKRLVPIVRDGALLGGVQDPAAAFGPLLPGFCKAFHSRVADATIPVTFLVAAMIADELPDARIFLLLIIIALLVRVPPSCCLSSSSAFSGIICSCDARSSIAMAPWSPTGVCRRASSGRQAGDGVFSEPKLLRMAVPFLSSLPRWCWR